MADNIINEINKFSTYSFDENSKRIVNLKSNEDTDIDEFLGIQYLLDTNKVKYRFQSNFEIKIIK